MADTQDVRDGFHQSYSLEGRFLDYLSTTIYEDNKARGFWEDGERPFGDIIALIHTELSEAFEEYRDGRTPYEVYYREDGKPEGILFELADAMIRIMDWCGHKQLPLHWAIEQKLAFNRTRPHKHGRQL